MKCLVESKFYIVVLNDNCDYEIIQEENILNLDYTQKNNLFLKMQYTCCVLNKLGNKYYSVRTSFDEIEKVGD